MCVAGLHAAAGVKEVNVNGFKRLINGQSSQGRQDRAAARQRGICPAIPYRSTTEDRLQFFPKVL